MLNRTIVLKATLN